MEIMEKCDICNKLFSNKSNLRKYIKSVHEKIKFNCEICDKEVSRKDKLKEHMKEHIIGEAVNLNVQ